MANDSRTESKQNESIKSLKRIFDKKNKKSKIPTGTYAYMKRKRSPIEVDKVMSKMKSDAQAMGGDFKSAGELKPLKGESRESFESRPSTKFFKVGGRVGLKDGSKGCGKAKAGKGKAYGKNS